LWNALLKKVLTSLFNADRSLVPALGKHAQGEVATDIAANVARCADSNANASLTPKTKANGCI